MLEVGLSLSCPHPQTVQTENHPMKQDKSDTLVHPASVSLIPSPNMINFSQQSSLQTVHSKLLITVLPHQGD